MSGTEKNILFILGEMRISVNKNVNRYSLKKKLSNKDLKNYKKSFWIYILTDGGKNSYISLN